MILVEFLGKLSWAYIIVGIAYGIKKFMETWIENRKDEKEYREHNKKIGGKK